ncbi:serine/threonine-protein kinase TNNI3K-like isoform X2 [Oscarella lobularis]|uniref:serine/threonine-protein kinase TNNI3K-like isoform X2 n=1 Tax=Oscarella lobularis TaxID=121494 RepID=UPI0033134888
MGNRIAFNKLAFGIAEGNVENVCQYVSKYPEWSKVAADQSGWTFLHIAAACGRIKIAECLITLGANIDVQTRLGETPLHIAILNRQTAAADFFIQNGSDIHKKTKTNIGALATACQKNAVAIAKRLVEKGFDIGDERSDNGTTALHWAVLYDHIEMIDYLISNGANMEAKNKWGTTPFLSAIISGKTRSICLLFQKGCNIYAKDNEGKGARELARLHGHRDQLLAIYDCEEERLAHLRAEFVSGNRLAGSHLAEELNVALSFPSHDQTQPLEASSFYNAVGGSHASALKDDTELPKKIQRLEAQLQEFRQALSEKKQNLQEATQQAILAEAKFENELAERERTANLLAQCEQECGNVKLALEEAERSLRKYDDSVQVSPKDLDLLDIKLGGGSYAEVQVGRWCGCHVAVKTFFDFLRVDVYRRRLEQEVSIWRQIHHPNVVSLIGVITQDDIPLRILSELLEGSLSDVIYAAGKDLLFLREQVDMAVGSTAGVAYLHQQGILHGDVRPTNVVVTALMEAKLCDLGAARFAEAFATSVGPMSPDYVAPERISHNSETRNSEQADMYSLGVSFIELMTGEFPAKDRRQSQGMSIQHGIMKQLALQLIKQDRNQRHSAEYCLGKLKTIQEMDEAYRKCPPKRMVKGKTHGEGKVKLVTELWI